jgi:hypothetical protein
MNEFYFDDIYLLKIYVKYFFYLGIFNIYFYQKLKKLYFDKNKKISELKINYPDFDNNFTEIIFNNDTSILVKEEEYTYYDDNNQKIETLEQKCLNEIKNIKYTYETLSNQKNFISINNTIDINTISINELKSYLNKFNLYYSLSEFHNYFKKLQKTKSLHSFFKKYNIDEKYKTFFNNDILNKIIIFLDKYNDIEGTWRYMTESQAFSF